MAMDYGLAASKWRQYQRFSNDDRLKSFLPDTKLLTANSFKYFIRRYPTLFLKPIDKGKGQGILVIERSKDGFMLYKDTQKQFFKTEKELFKKISLYVKKASHYIIQQGIRLISWRGRPIDFRLYAVRTGKSWRSLGIMGKWAAPNRRITNRSVGGTAVSFRTALQKAGGFSKKHCQELEIQALQLGQYLGSNYFNYAPELGLDFGVDHRKKLYLIEGNTLPGIQLFASHPNSNVRAEVRAAHYKAKRKARRHKRKR